MRWPRRRNASKGINTCGFSGEQPPPPPPLSALEQTPRRRPFLEQKRGTPCTPSTPSTALMSTPRSPSSPSDSYCQEPSSPGVGSRTSAEHVSEIIFQEHFRSPEIGSWGYCKSPSKCTSPRDEAAQLQISRQRSRDDEGEPRWASLGQRAKLSRPFFRWGSK